MQLLRQCCAGSSQLLRQCCAWCSTERMKDRDSIIEALSAAMISDKRRKAQSFLDKCSKQQGFTPELLHIICDHSVCEVVRLSAVVYFKNNVHRHWKVTDADDSYLKPQEDINPKRCLSDEDKALIREHIIDAVCAADESHRTLLCTAILLILRADFPKNWPDFAEKLTAKIRQAPNASMLAGALLIVHRFLKVYENNWLMDTDVIVVPFSKIEPAVSHRCFELLDMQSTEAVSVQIQGLKIIYLRTEFTNNFHMLPLSKLYEWIKFAIAILNRSCPEELDSIRYEEELSRTVWWKSKKWAAKLLGRLFQRCRYPHYADKHYVFSARKFLTEWAPLAIESLLVILNAVSNGDHVSDRVLSLILSFTNNAIALSVCWQIVKPHALELIERLLFPILCYGDVAEDGWRKDVEEPILFKFAAFKNLLHVAHDAGKLLIGLARTSDVAESIFFFVVQVLSCSVNSREIEGAFRVLGELCVHLTRNKKCNHNVEQLLKTFVVGHLRHPCKFVRARAAWCIKQYSEACFFHTDTLAKIIDSLVQRLGDQNEEILVKVESASTIQCLLKHQEKVPALMRPSVGVIIVKVLELLAKTKIADVIYVIDELFEQYNEDVPIASVVADHLCHIILEELCTFTIGMPSANIFFEIGNTFRKIIAKGHMVTSVKVEESVVKVVDAMLETAPTFYCGALRLLQSILHSYVSDSLWDVLDNLYDVFKKRNGIYELPFFELGRVLHLYIVTHTESFFAFSHRVAVVLDMCITTMKTDSAGDERRLYATKIMECILLECSSHTTEVIPTILMTIFERLTKPFQEGLNLKPLVLLVVVAALYMNLDVSLQAFHHIAPNHSNLLEYICDEFFTCYKKMKGTHNRRMAVIGICLYFHLPPPLRPSVISTNPKKVLEVSLSIFENLLRERKSVAQKKNEESETYDYGEKSNDEADRKVPTKGQCNRKFHETEHLSDDEDDIEEVTLGYMDATVKEDSCADRDDEDGVSDSATQSSLEQEEKEIETFTTKFDGENGPNVFALFKRTMNDFERNEPELYRKMVGNLSPNVAESFQNLIKKCEQHAKS